MNESVNVSYSSMYSSGYVRNPAYFQGKFKNDEPHIEHVRKINSNVQRLIHTYLPLSFFNDDSHDSTTKIMKKKLTSTYDITQGKVYVKESVPKTVVDEKTSFCIRAILRILEIFSLKIPPVANNTVEQFTPQEALQLSQKVITEPHKDNPKGKSTLGMVMALSENIVKKKKNNHRLPDALWNRICTFIPYANWSDFHIKSRTLLQNFDCGMTRNFLAEIFRLNSQVFNTLPNPDVTRQLMTLTGFHPKALKKPQTNLDDKTLNAIARNGSQLSHLSLRKGHFNLDAFDRLLQSCPHIETLELNDFDTNNFDGLIALITTRLPELKSLKVVNCPHMTDQSLFTLAVKNNLKSFEYVCSNHTSQLTDFGFTPFLSNSHLTSFKVRGCPQLTNASVGVLLGVQEEEDEKSPLKELCLAHCGIDEVTLEMIGDRCRNLQFLELGFFANQEITFGQEFEGLANCTKLRTFIISDAKDLLESQMETVLAEWPHLENLEVYRCANITTTFFDGLNLSETNELIQTIKYEPVRESHLPPPAILSAASNYNSLQIKTVDLSHCQVDQKDLLNLIEKQAPFLENLRLYHCGAFNDDLLLKLAACPRLKTLEIETENPGDHAFTDKGIEQLVKGCPHLTILHLKSKNCPSTTPLSIKTFIALATYAINLIHLELSHVSVENNQINVLFHFKQRCINLIHFVLNHSIYPVHEKLNFIR